MNKLDKGTKIKIDLDTSNLKSILTNFENGEVKGIELKQEPHPSIVELTEDLLLENYENTDNRLVYAYKNKTYISDRIKRITLTNIMKLPHDNGIELISHNERYCIETESNAYYIELLNQGD